MVILQEIKPTLVHVPFHTCDATLDPFRLSGVRTSFYGLDEDLTPVSLPRLAYGEYFLWTNYYGICGAVTERLKSHYGERLIIDDTHAFHHGGHSGHWSFTSARKWFGVPDGAYLFSPRPISVVAPRFAGASVGHAVLRSVGRQKEAYAAYLRYEASLTSAVNRISVISNGLLRGLDLNWTKAKRMINFAYFKERLGHLNQLNMGLDLVDVPFCYPYLTATAVDRTALHAQGFFIPRLWPDVCARNMDGFDFDKRLSADLLPLPIDHRYTPEDLDSLIDHLLNSK